MAYPGTCGCGAPSSETRCTCGSLHNPLLLADAMRGHSTKAQPRVNAADCMVTKESTLTADERTEHVTSSSQSEFGRAGRFTLPIPVGALGPNRAVESDS